MNHTLPVEVDGKDVRQFLHEDAGHLEGPDDSPVVLGLEHGGYVAGEGGGREGGREGEREKRREKQGRKRGRVNAINMHVMM